jgi:hypothetical protein
VCVLPLFQVEVGGFFVFVFLRSVNTEFTRNPFVIQTQQFPTVLYRNLRLTKPTLAKKDVFRVSSYCRHVLD